MSQTKQACKESQITIGMLEFRPTKEKFEAVGKMVWEILNRPESKRTYLKYKGKELICYECVIQGTWGEDYVNKTS